ncbi:MAG: CBS domain-containing protein [Nitrospirae bacterium]|nr:CBS domain-containing protein [Nitrospirota bacterium]
MARLKSIEDLKNLRLLLKEETFPEGKERIRACTGTACMATGANKVIERIEQKAKEKGLDIQVVKTGCQGLCQKGPVMKIEPFGYFYQKVKEDDAEAIVSNTLSAGYPVRYLLNRDSLLVEPHEIMDELPFYKKQMRVALRNNGRIDPLNIYHYIAVGGYSALEKALSSMTPDQVLDEVDRANLRGRGGAGFPAGKKWRHTKRAPGDLKFVIANGDEGDPGAFMDRSIMEGDPHSLIEGMLLCAYAIGAEYGFIYVRHEYPLAVKNLRHAIKQAEDLGLLGENILGTDFSFYLDIREGAGAFVCGESTALVASIEGDRGFPRPRPPRLSEPGGGLWGIPSNLNNIETYACVPPIIENGADWFRSIGTESSPGTKVFALTGKVKNTGLVEVPMGITLREIIFDIGGGILGDKKFKAVQTGGPSGGCLPEEYLDLPVDFDSLKKVGSMMGSGGMVVMDEDTCMVDVAKYFLSFTQAESCGKCPPCRIGTYQMLQILERITNGEGQPGDIERLIKYGKLTQAGSLCGLGQSAPNPVLSTIKYFREEYEEHIYDKYCRAKVCNGLGVFTIDLTQCIRCGLCKEACAFDAVKETKDAFIIDRDYCTKCKACYMVCPVDAVKIWKERHLKMVEALKIPPEKIETIERRVKMKLKDILESKPREVFTVRKDKSVAYAVKFMSDHNIGALLVVDENDKLVGMFTERDVVHCTAKGIDLDSEPVENVMSKDLITFSPDDDISVAVQMVAEKKKRHLPVLEGDKIVGLINYRDVVSYLLPEVFYLSEALY